MPVQETITIKFIPDGHPQLIAAIKKLNVETKKLTGSTAGVITATKASTIVTTKAAKATGVLDTRGKRLAATNSMLANSFATLRSKMLLVAFAGTMAAKPLFQLVKAQSDAEEIANKFNVVFGKQTDIVREWANALGASVGRAGSELEFMLSTLQDTFVPLGFSREAATQLSTSLTKLALDVASFNNKADADVIRDFQSALVGNHETVRKYGIVMTEASLQAEALSSGIIGVERELTQSEKVQARLNILWAGSKDAIGDLDRTQDSFANTLKRFNSEVLIARQELGEKLMPIARDLLVVMSELVGHFKDTAVLKGYATAIGAVSIALVGARIHTLGWASALTTLKIAAAKTLILGLAIAVGELSARIIYGKNSTKALTDEMKELEELQKKLLSGEGGVDKLTSAELDLAAVTDRLAELRAKLKKNTDDLEKAQKALNDEQEKQDLALMQERIKELTASISLLTEQEKAELKILRMKNDLLDKEKKLRQDIMATSIAMGFENKKTATVALQAAGKEVMAYIQVAMAKEFEKAIKFIPVPPPLSLIHI